MNKMSIINDLLKMAAVAVENESLEAGYNVREISLNNEYPVAGKTAYAITKFSVVFTDAWTLTLINGQELKPVFLSKTPGAKLVLGNSATTFKDWSISRNSPSWTGSVMVYDGEIINNCASVTGPRGSPTGFIVLREEDLNG